MLTIALPNKGRLAAGVRDLLEDAGLPVRAASERSLLASLGAEFAAIFVRAQDIPEFVADGAADAGITGWDLVRESGRPLDVLMDLELGRCRLVVAAREDSGVTAVAELPDGARVATCFPRLTQEYFDGIARKITLVPVSGAAEIAPHLGIADLVVDLTSTGSTLRVNGLREVATILDSTARLVTAASQADTVRSRALDDLTIALGSVLRARQQRYLMVNAPRARLAEVRACLPGISGPTVGHVLDSGRFVAVHAVVAVDTIYRTIAELKALGCEGILVTRIERLVP